MTIVMDVKRCMKATLLAIIILSVVTWLSHIYSCIKTFMESLPSVVSAVIAPKCLFIFTNIIVVFLVSESKLSRRRSKLRKTSVDAAARDEDMLQYIQKQKEMLLTEALLPTTIIAESKQEQENKMAMAVYGQKDSPIQNEDVQMLFAVDEERVNSVVKHGVRVNKYEKKVGHQLVLHNIEEVQEEVKEEGNLELDLQEEASGYTEKERTSEEELEEWDLPPADELNRRVENFIARFNMERQLEEAKMLVYCY